MNGFWHKAIGCGDLVVALWCVVMSDHAVTAQCRDCYVREAQHLTQNIVRVLTQRWRAAHGQRLAAHPDGAAHENTARAKKFGRQLHGRFGLPVFEVDERYSTTEALANGARDADAESACIILEQFLRSLA